VLDAPLPKRFRIVRMLGEGGMGIVYEAHDREHDVRIAIKTVRELTAESLARFKREFRALADLHHPNLVQLGELISEGDQWFFTMELVGGSDFLDYVRKRPAGFDEPKLRAALPQLAAALGALHAAEKVHRDLKSSNVRIAHDGRLVLLDFGLVAEFSANASVSQTIVGTPAYMAPEQAASGAVGPAADWYAFGVLLYEALTGALPFDGTAIEIMMRKQQEDPAPPSRVAPGVPADLDELCASLLRFDPKLRPTEPEIARVLGVPRRNASIPSLISSVTSAPFVGRAVELAALHDAFAASRTQAATVLVEGESGVGKSCLVLRFLRDVAVEEPRLVVLKGRCYEREAVPFKGFDGVVDALTSFLMHEPEAARLLPTRPGPLTQVFPVLRRADVIARATREVPQPLDPFELRSRAFAALRELLTRLGDDRPLAIVIDDLQWSDDDSLALLADLLRPPEAPALLLVATSRDPKLALPGDVRHLPVGRLSPDEARDLAAVLLASAAPGDRGSARAIAAEAEGHPFFIDALARHAATRSDTVGKLEDALWARVDALPAGARRMMELIATAGGPVGQDVLASASGEEDFARTLALLRVAHLASTSAARSHNTIEPYHDRVREAVLAHLDESSRRARHLDLARALERTGSRDSEKLYQHWEGAGDAEQAARHALTAADAAATKLAFDRASKLYEVALEKGKHGSDERRAIYELLGNALANAGRGARAAAAYREAGSGAPVAMSREMQRRAADQLMRGGHPDEGIDALRGVLATINMRLPGSAWLALASLMFWRAWLRVRGLGFTPRDPTEIAADQLVRVDTCWSVSHGLAMIDNIRGAAFQAKHLALALQTGERRRVVRALALEIPFLARSGIRVHKRVDALMQRTEAMATALDDPYSLGLLSTTSALAHHLLGRFKRALAAAERGDAILRDCAGAAWELGNARMFALNALAYCGPLPELCRRQPIYAREAAERGDMYATVQFRIGHPTLRWVILDQPEAGHADIDDAMAMWSQRSFLVEHYYELIGRTNIDLYSGEAGRASERLAVAWRPLKKSLLQFVQAVRVMVGAARGRVAIATGALALAARDARALVREKVPWAAALAAGLRAGIESDRARRLALLADAASQFAACDMELHAASARRVRGELLGGDAGAALVAENDAWMRAQSVVAPAKIAAMLVPTS
jgi:hypothetical protein